MPTAGLAFSTDPPARERVPAGWRRTFERAVPGAGHARGHGASSSSAEGTAPRLSGGCPIPRPADPDLSLIHDGDPAAAVGGCVSPSA